MIIGIVLGVAGAAAGSFSRWWVGRHLQPAGVSDLDSYPRRLCRGLIMSAVKAYGGNYFKLPVIGNMAEKFANK